MLLNEYSSPKHCSFTSTAAVFLTFTGRFVNCTAFVAGGSRRADRRVRQM